MKKAFRQKKVNIVGIGIIASILVFLVVYTVLARTLVLLLNKGNNIGLLLLVILLELIAFISSLCVSIWQTDDLSQRLIIKSAGISFGANLIIIAFLSYGSLYILYPEIFEGLELYEWVMVFPTVLLDFSIYVLGHPMYLFILSIVTYFLLFIIILDYFYEKGGKKRV